MKQSRSNLFSFGRILGLVFLASCQTVPPDPELILPAQFSWHEKPIITAKHLTPNTAYTLTLERPSKQSSDKSLKSVSSYVTDETGQLSTASNTVFEIYAPFRSMKSVDEKSPIQDGFVQIQLMDESGMIILEQSVRFGADRSTMTETALATEFPGAFILKPKTQSRPLPALVVLGGSEGGDRSARFQAPQFVDQGFVVLGLPYYSPAWYNQTQQFPDLPQAFDNLPIDYLESAVAKLRLDKQVDADRILLLGGSKGAEFVMLAGALIPNDSPGGGFCGIVADVPTDVVWEGWGRQDSDERYSGFSWRGEELPFVPYVDMEKVFATRQTGGDYTMTDAHENGRKQFPNRVIDARINVEAIDEPLMLIGGDKDETWASAKMSRMVTQSRDAVNLETETYVYSDASHAVGGSPFSSVNEADFRARVENYPAMVSFLKRHARRNNCRG